MKKEYTLDSIVYSHRAQGKWKFVLGNHSVLLNPNGTENAHKVARILNGSVKRSGGVDNMARANISKTCAS